MREGRRVENQSKDRTYYVHSYNSHHLEASCRKADIRLQLGPILDETGQVGNGKLILSDRAWEELLGRTASQLVHTDLEVLRYLEQRLLFLRVSMGFALKLDDEIGRLAIWCVKN